MYVCMYLYLLQWAISCLCVFVASCISSVLYFSILLFKKNLIYYFLTMTALFCLLCGVLLMSCKWCCPANENVFYFGNMQQLLGIKILMWNNKTVKCKGKRTLNSREKHTIKCNTSLGLTWKSTKDYCSPPESEAGNTLLLLLLSNKWNQRTFIIFGL